MSPFLAILLSDFPLTGHKWLDWVIGILVALVIGIACGLAANFPRQTLAIFKKWLFAIFYNYFSLESYLKSEIVAKGALSAVYVGREHRYFRLDIANASNRLLYVEEVYVVNEANEKVPEDLWSGKNVAMQHLHFAVPPNSTQPFYLHPFLPHAKSVVKVYLISSEGVLFETDYFEPTFDLQ